LGNLNSFVPIWVLKQLLHLNLHTIRNIWAISTSLNHVWVIEQLHSNLGTIGTIWQIGRVSFRFAYIINIWANYNSPNQIWAN